MKNDLDDAVCGILSSVDMKSLIAVLSPESHVTHDAFKYVFNLSICF